MTKKGEPHTWIYKVPGDHYDSYVSDAERDLRDGCARFVWYVSTWVEFHQGPYFEENDEETWQVEALSDSTEQQKYKDAFKESIQNGWGNGAIWLMHKTEGVKDLWCDIVVNYVGDREKAHLVLLALKNPRATKPRPERLRRVLGPEDANTSNFQYDGFRANCAARANPWVGENPIDMMLPYERIVKHDTQGKQVVAYTNHDGVDSDGKAQAFKQQTSQHEFGHYLGIGHFCFEAAEANAAGQYCEGKTAWEMDDLMAKGNKFRAHWLRKPFVNRLGAHEYVGTHVDAYMAKGHTDSGGGTRDRRPWI